MYAIAFDMLIAQLVRNYGEPYNPSLANLYNAIQALSSIKWFRESVRDIRAFKVEDWSDFTESVKHPENNLRNISKRRPMKK